MTPKEIEDKIRELEIRIRTLENERKIIPIPYPAPYPKPEKWPKPWEIKWWSRQ